MGGGAKRDRAAERETQRDAQAVERLRQGDARALDDLFRRYRDAAYRIAYRLVGNQEDALDVVQEAFIHVLRGIQAFRGQSLFRTWLYRIVTHAALDYRRWRAMRKAESLEAEAAPSASAHQGGRTPQKEAADKDLHRAIEKAMTNISEKNRAALILFAVEGLSYREVAEVLGISVGTVMSRIFNARQRLRELLAPEIA